MSDNNLTETGILTVSLESEMQRSYLDYAMSVIVSRAIPDVRDGLKPVHRRILYVMKEIGCDYNRAYKKSARIVGEVMGKYHPHGDVAIYDSLVRLAQDFSVRETLIDGQGNFGSIDDDPPAAMRYTEVRLEKITHTLMEDLDKDTVSFSPNYDNSEMEPVVLPASFPNILVNGSEGIAVGMATSIPTHNLGEVIDACLAYIQNPDISMEEIIKIVPGPDFPTAGIIVGRNGCYNAIKTGRGSVIIRGRTEIETHKNGKESIIITQMPYQVIKSKLIEKIAELVKDKRVEGITEIRDESNKKGIRVVIDLRKDVSSSVILNQLYKFTSLQTSFSSNMLVLHKGRPQLMNVKQIITAFINFRQEIVSRRIAFLLSKARARAHILIGLHIAVDSIDEVIQIIRSSANVDEAKERLLAKSWPVGGVEKLIGLVGDTKNIIKDGDFSFTETQVKAILEMRLSRLTGLERENIIKELEGLGKEIQDYLDILASKQRLFAILSQELASIKEEFATPRLTVIEDSDAEVDLEELMQREDVVVTVTMNGYIKRSPLSVYNAQRRGGKGKIAMKTQDDDAITDLFVANTHSPILFFSNKGQVYRMKGYQLPLGSLQSKGRYVMQLLPLTQDEKVTSFLTLPVDKKEWDGLNLIFATKNGSIRRSSIDEFEHIQRNGKIAIKLEDSDALVDVKLARDEDHILLATKNGLALRFSVDSIRVIKSRNSSGVKGITLESKDTVISLSILSDGENDNSTRDIFLKIPVERRLKIAQLAKKLEELKVVNGEEKPKPSPSTSGLFAQPGEPDTQIEVCEKEMSDLVQVLSKEYQIPAATIQDWCAREEFLLTVTEKGYGKRSSTYEYRITGRGGKGVKNIITSDRNGCVVASFVVGRADNVIAIAESGQSIRFVVDDVSIFGRSSQGVRLMNIASGDKIVSITRVQGSPESPDASGDQEGLQEGVAIDANVT